MSKSTLVSILWFVNFLVSLVVMLAAPIKLGCTNKAGGVMLAAFFVVIFLLFKAKSFLTPAPEDVQQ